MSVDQKDVSQIGVKSKKDNLLNLKYFLETGPCSGLKKRSGYYSLFMSLATCRNILRSYFHRRTTTGFKIYVHLHLQY